MILYHGTSENRLRSILDEDRLTVASRHTAVCLSSRYIPARYWASLSAVTDENVPVVLELHAKCLLETGYTLIPYSDPAWGEGQCDWEYEVRIEEDVDPLSDVLINHYKVSWDNKRVRIPSELRENT